MNRNFSLKFKKIDIVGIIITFILSLSFMIGVLVYFNTSSKSRYVEVYHQNVLLKDYTTNLNTLTEEKTLILKKEDYPKLKDDFTILMNNEKGIRVINITCDDNTCMNQNWVNIVGLPIICIPNQVKVIIKSSTYNDEDIIMCEPVKWGEYNEYQF
ncbi:MAG: NusG domain II-containing protein [Bacilli bacterium]|nr:NusG domain II-containing protein [Bacilli bacterium]